MKQKIKRTINNYKYIQGVDKYKQRQPKVGRKKKLGHAVKHKNQKAKHHLNS